jgi:ATP-dependent RNA helicase HelY
VLADMIRVWGELDGVEKEHHLSFLREPDLGFAWTAHVWARGRSLEQVLSGDLTPGDFVRAVKQLIDLLDQIASAAPTAPARRAAEAPAPAAGPGSVPAPSAEAEAAAVPAPSPAADPAPRTLSMTARAAIDAMRRGVVAYSAVAG